MKPQAQDPGDVQDEVRQLMELVRVLARTLGFNNAALARSAKVPLASLVRYFKGEGEPKIEFLLAVVRTLGLEVREFFELAYPEPAATSAARAKVERFLGPVRPGKLLEPPPPPKPEPRPELVLPTREEIERMMDELRRDVRELIEGRAKQEKSATPGKPKPAKTSKKNGES